MTYVAAIFLVVLCYPATLVHSTGISSEPCDTEKKKEAAVEACSFLLELPYSDCLLEMGLDQAKKKFQMCLEIYCESGEPGVCSFATILSFVCNQTWHVTVEIPEDCVPTTTTSTTTTTKPPGPCETKEEREQAEQVCSFLLDRDSAFSQCLLAMGLEQAKSKFQLCIEIYCEEGLQGVCEFAISFADYCENQWNVDIDDDDMPDGCATTTTEIVTTPYTLCIDAPEKDENAVNACSFLLDGSSSIYKCLRYFDHVKIQRFYKICLQIFCDMGYNGVCCFAEHIPEICECQYGIEVELDLDYCLPDTTTTQASTTTSSLNICVGQPAQDENAIEACSWLLEFDSPFYSCGIIMGVEKVKQFFQICVHTYCNAGMLGVCSFAENVEDICASKNIETGPILDEICDKSTTTTTTTKPQTICDNPFKSEQAKKLCFMIGTSHSPYFQCLKAVDDNTLSKWMKECMKLYCDDGIDGICIFTDRLSDRCEDDYGITVMGELDMCEEDEPTTTRPDCVDIPMNDENAIEACDFLLDVNSPFFECLDQFSLEKRKLMFATCTEVYCESGIVGVCELAENIADICEESGYPVSDKPDICDNTSTKPPQSPCETKEETEEAREACSFILDSNTIFSDCLDKFDMHKRKKLFMICLQIYCEEGMEGVCCFAEHIPVICDVQFDIVIIGTIDECQETTTVAPRCVEEPHRDPNARKKCEDIIDSNSPFNPCMQQMDLGLVKKYYGDCVDIYCMYGDVAVCKLYKMLTYVCKDEYNITVRYDCQP